MTKVRPMSEADEQGVLEMVAALLSIAPRDRESRLREMCSSDGVMRDRVVSVLRGLTEQISGPASESSEPWESLSNAQAPARIGAYRIVRLIGAGGMGQVYEAEQDRPHRPVALKLLHPSRMSESVRVCAPP